MSEMAAPSDGVNVRQEQDENAIPVPVNEQPDATQDDNLVEQTDNSGEPETEPVSQDPAAVTNGDDEDDGEEDSDGESDSKEAAAN